MKKLKNGKFTKTSTQHPSEPRRKTIKRKGKENRDKEKENRDKK